MENTSQWAKCSTCKKPIGFGESYFQCSVSTCRHKRKGFRFCSVPCWDAHLGFMNHREAYAEEAQAPTDKEIDSMSEPATPIVPMNDDSNDSNKNDYEAIAKKMETDTLVVVSKVKKFIKEEAGLNTSQCYVDALTTKVVAACLEGIGCAKKSGRKTVMGRDILPE